MAAALAAAPLLVAQTQATFYRAFEDGREAERSGRWAEALAAYRRAVALRPAPAARVIIYGNNLLDGYYPYSRMARCHLELGELKDAETQLARAERLGEPSAPREALLRRLSDLRSASHPPDPSPASTAPPAATPPVIVPQPAPFPELPPHPPLAPAEVSRRPQDTPGRTGASAARLLPPRDAHVPPPVRPERDRLPGAPAPSSVPASTAPPQAPAPLPFSIHPLRSFGLGALGAALIALLFWRRKRSGGEALAFSDPQRLGPYQVDRLLGRGGFASTYLARHEGTHQEVALKLLHPHRQDDPEFLSRFRQEARLGTLLVHPNLVRLLDPGPETGVPWLAMEYVSGLRLDQKLRTDGPPPLAELLDIALGVARGMAFAHAHGIVHRDLKPANVMLSPEGVKIMDFGISRIMDAETLTTTYAFLGTPLYAAPEAQLKTQVGPPTDRYSLGIMLFEMLTGHPPFEGETPFEILDQHRGTALPDLAAQRPDAPSALVRLTERLCRKQPDERPEDSEVIRILERLAAEAAGPLPLD